jgi:hypothetical protein
MAPARKTEWFNLIAQQAPGLGHSMKRRRRQSCEALSRKVSRLAKVVATFVLVAFSLMAEAMPDASASSSLPDAIQAGVAEKLFRLDCGRSLANDESVWTPGENVRPVR